MRVHILIMATVVLGAVPALASPSDKPARAPGAAHAGDAATPDHVLQSLLAGNRVYVAGHGTCGGQTPARRAEVATAQHPSAIVVSCSDSRVPPEVVFNQGIGDLFVVRVAGNVIDDQVLGSIEYAAEHLGAHLIVVLGHERCGAVKATVDGGAAPGHIDSIVKKIRGAVEQARKQPGDVLDNAVRANVAASVAEIQSSQPLLAPLAKKGEIKVVGARYDLDSGLVELVR